MVAETDRMLLDIDRLCFSYSDKSLFSGLNLTAQSGRITAIIGPSGCGKSTLLRLIGGLLKPQQGSIQLDGKELTQLSPVAWRTVRKKMGFLFQSAALFPSLNVFENVTFPLRQHTTLPEAMMRDIVLFKLESVGLRGAAHLNPMQLSGGMARRVALARAIVLDPQFMMYDEPFIGLDPIGMGVIKRLIVDLNSALGITTILVSHHIADVFQLADYVYLLVNGAIRTQGTPKQLWRHADASIQQFMQGLPDGPVAFHYPAQDYATDLLNPVS